MENIKELRNWIDVNIKSIGLKEYEMFITKQVGHCYSTWNNEFRDFTGLTLRSYLISEKMKICWDYKLRNRNCSNDELMSMVNYDLTEKSFRNHMNKNRSECDSEAVYLFHNTSVLSEVLVRLVLYLDLAEPQIKEYSFSIDHNVQGTIYQINIVSSTEKVHSYNAYINLEDLSLSFGGPLVEDSSDIEGVGRFYYGMCVYTQYLDRISRVIKKQFGLSLTKSIKNWDDFYKAEFKNFLLHALLGANAKQDRMLIEINRKSDFILITDKKLNSIKEVTINRCKDKLENMYGVTYDTMLNYVHAAKKPGYLNMKRVLETVDNLQDEKAIKLFFELTECPYLDDFLFSELESDLDNEAIYKLAQRSKEQIIRFLISFKKEIKQYTDEDEEYGEEEIHDWCRNMMKKW